MMLPSVIDIRHKNVIEDHRAEAQHQNLSRLPDVKCGVIAVCLKRLPVCPFLIAEAAHAVPEKVSKEAQLISLMPVVRGYDHTVFKMEQQDLAAFRISIKLDR